MPLEIKVGHRYRTRSGDVVEIVGFEDYKYTPRLYKGFLETGKVLYFTVNGQSSEAKYDLIKEVIIVCHICGDDTGKHTPDCTSFLPGIYHVATP